MPIVHHVLTPNKLKRKLLKKLIDQEFYLPDGVFYDIYAYPETFIKEEAHLLLKYVNRKIVSIMLVSKGEYFDWQHIYQKLTNMYGIVGFYTKTEHRGKGYATELFDYFKNNIDVGKIAVCSEALSMVKSYEKKKLFVIP